MKIFYKIKKIFIWEHFKRAISWFFFMYTNFSWDYFYLIKLLEKK